MTDLTNLPTELETRVEIRFQDCDPFGHLNNARYSDYFMNARQDQLAEHYKFRLFEHGKQMNEAWVVSRSYLAYLYPAATAEYVRIRTRLIDYSENRLVVEGVMLDDQGRRIKAAVWFEFAYVSAATGRAATHPENLMQLFRAVAIPGIYHEDGFNRRVEALRAESRAARGAAIPA